MTQFLKDVYKTLEYQQMVDFLQDLGFSADDAELTICALILIGGKFKR